MGEGRSRITALKACFSNEINVSLACFITIIIRWRSDTTIISSHIASNTISGTRHTHLEVTAQPITLITLKTSPPHFRKRTLPKQPISDLLTGDNLLKIGDISNGIISGLLTMSGYVI